MRIFFRVPIFRCLVIVAREASGVEGGEANGRAKKSHKTNSTNPEYLYFPRRNRPNESEPYHRCENTENKNQSDSNCIDSENATRDENGSLADVAKGREVEESNELEEFEEIEGRMDSESETTPFLRYSAERKWSDFYRFKYPHPLPPNHGPDPRNPNYLGGGTYGQVYRLVDNRSGQERAGKWINMERWQRSWVDLQKEVFAMARLDHPNILRVYDLFIVKRDKKTGQSEHAILVMELVEGKTLAEENMEQKKIQNGLHPHRTGSDSFPYQYMTRAQVGDLMVQLLEGLSYLAGRGLIHNDLKSINVMVARVDQKDPQTGKRTMKRVVKILDFGFIANILPGVLHADQGGTYEYFSPEVLLSVAQWGRFYTRRNGAGLVPGYQNALADAYAAGLMCCETVMQEGFWGSAKSFESDYRQLFVQKQIPQNPQNPFAAPPWTERAQKCVTHSQWEGLPEQNRGAEQNFLQIDHTNSSATSATQEDKIEHATIR